MLIEFSTPQIRHIYYDAYLKNLNPKLHVKSIIHDNIHSVVKDLREYVCHKNQLALKLAIIMYTSHSRDNICDIKQKFCILLGQNSVT